MGAVVRQRARRLFATKRPLQVPDLGQIDNGLQEIVWNVARFAELTTGSFRLAAVVAKSA
jgi:hypothetical protein